MSTDYMNPVFLIAANVDVYIRGVIRRLTCGHILPLYRRRGYADSHVFRIRHAATVVLLVIPAWATTIVLCRSSNWIIVGADGMYSHPGAKPTTICKIHRTPAMFWTSTGVYSQ